MKANIFLAHIFVKAYIWDMGTRSSQFDMERFFQALGDNTRLRLLNLMGDQELCVCYFAEILAQGQPKISRHLAYLRRAGIVQARRDGKWMHYRLSMPQDESAAAILQEGRKQLVPGGDDPGEAQQSHQYDQ